MANKISITIPAVVQKEVVHSGKEKGCADATVVEDNIDAGMIAIAESGSEYGSGDDALIALFQEVIIPIVFRCHAARPTSRLAVPVLSPSTFVLSISYFASQLLRCLPAQPPSCPAASLFWHGRNVFPKMLDVTLFYYLRTSPFFPLLEN